MSHTCHASGCENNCHPTKLMCLSCWSKVSKQTQNEVYKHYTSGQCNNMSLIKKDWLLATRKAILEVKAKS